MCSSPCKRTKTQICENDDVMVLCVRAIACLRVLQNNAPDIPNYSDGLQDCVCAAQDREFIDVSSQV